MQCFQEFNGNNNINFFNNNNIANYGNFCSNNLFFQQNDNQKNFDMNIQKINNVINNNNNNNIFDQNINNNYKVINISFEGEIKIEDFDGYDFMYDIQINTYSNPEEIIGNLLFKFCKRFYISQDDYISCSMDKKLIIQIIQYQK